MNIDVVIKLTKRYKCALSPVLSSLLHRHHQPLILTATDKKKKLINARPSPLRHVKSNKNTITAEQRIHDCRWERYPAKFSEHFKRW